MAKYKVIITVTETYSTIVDAKNEKDAEGKAEAIRSLTNTPFFPVLHFDGTQGLKYETEELKASVVRI